jgi:hypothetical protein
MALPAAPSPRFKVDDAKALPYVARELSLKEIRDLDVYTFTSPKNAMRRIRIVGIPALVLALRLEFNPDVESYVERPRLLKCSSDVFEFSFWYRTVNGRESLPLLVHAADSAPAIAGRWRHRKAEQLLIAAQEAHLPLEFVFESDLIDQGAEFSTWLRMLPSVQLAHRYPHRFELRTRVMEVAATPERCRISQIVDALGGYVAADIRCIVCDLIHAGILVIDPKARLTQHTICRRGCSHEN